MNEQVKYTPPPITGYRQLTQTEVDAINAVKQLGCHIETHLSNVKEHVTKQRYAIRVVTDPTDSRWVDITDPAEQQRLDLAEPERWLAMARTDFQNALMKLTRAIAQPTTF